MQAYEIWSEPGDDVPAHLFGVQSALSFRLACLKQFGYRDVDYDCESMTYCGNKLTNRRKT